MSNDENFFLVSLDGIDETQRSLVQSRVESLATSWWHQQSNVWIVQGGASSSFWRETLAVFVPKVPSSLYIFKLPKDGEREWSGQHKVSKWTWLLEKYAAPSGVAPKQDSGP